MEHTVTSLRHFRLVVSRNGGLSAQTPEFENGAVISVCAGVEDAGT